MAKAPTPRVIFVRHGQTEWSKSGQYTSITDLELTPFGVKQMKQTGKYLIGDAPTHLINPAHVTHVITSPRTRAKQTAGLLFESISPDKTSHIAHSEDNDLREWEYGDYEGLLTAQIIQLRQSRGLGSEWNIWEYGCENGEEADEVTRRLDDFIAKLQTIQGRAIAENKPSDIIIVAHGHILRCFAARWVKRSIHTNPQFMLDAGGVGVLSYQHHNVEEPAIFIPGAFVVPVEEEGADL